MIYNFFDKRTSATCANKFADGAVISEFIINQEMAEKLHKPINRKFEK